MCVSSDGLLMAMSTDLDRGTGGPVRRDRRGADQPLPRCRRAASATATSTRSWSRCRPGFLFVASISDGSCLGILTDKSADVGLVGYEMTMLVDRFGAVLTPQVRAGLRTALAVGLIRRPRTR